MLRFKVGDKVRCLDNEGMDDYLEEGNVYEVRSPEYIAWGGCIMVDIVGVGPCFSYRFELVREEPIKGEQKSFKDFLTPMCRVLFGDGQMTLHLEGVFFYDGTIIRARVTDFNPETASIIEWEDENDGVWVIDKIYNLPENIFAYDDLNTTGELVWENPVFKKKNEIADVEEQINNLNVKICHLQVAKANLKDNISYCLKEISRLNIKLKELKNGK